ncbi:MAG: hypothetical protein ABI461_16935, partial [Polyangiaceae bacterium]
VKADLQALVTGKLTSVTGDPTAACNGYIGSTFTIAVIVAPNDADKSTYNLTFTDGVSHASSGVGDASFYNDGDQTHGTSGPGYHAHKGNVTCDIDSPAPPDTTMKTTPSGDGYTVTPSDETAYVTLMGKVCTDIFAAQ